MTIVKLANNLAYKSSEREILMKEKNTSIVATEGSFFFVVLKFNRAKYYLADYKLTISLDKTSAMIFADGDLARDYATKAENFYSKIASDETLAFTEEYTNILEFNCMS